MAIVEDVFSGAPGAAVAAGAAVLVLPRIFPGLGPPLRSALKSGLTLYLESESEAEGGLIDKLVDGTLKGVLAALSAPGSEQDRRAVVTRATEHFQKVARARSSRHGWNEADRAARYRRHMTKLKQAIHEAQHQRPRAEQSLLKDAAASVSEDW